MNEVNGSTMYEIKIFMVKVVSIIIIRNHTKCPSTHKGIELFIEETSGT